MISYRGTVTQVREFVLGDRVEFSLSRGSVYALTFFPLSPMQDSEKLAVNQLTKSLSSDLMIINFFFFLFKPASLRSPPFPEMMVHRRFCVAVRVEATRT